jgi:hypothetical protein
MFSLTPHPRETRWGEVTRVEVDPAPRISGLRFLRRAGTLGTGFVGLGLLVVSLVVLRGSGALPPVVYFGFVGALLALSPGCWLAATLTLRRVPDRIAFDDQRVMVHFLDGPVREVSWTDPKLALDLLNLGGRDFTRGTVLLTGRGKNGRLDAAITIEGAAALRTEAVRQGLAVESSVEGDSSHEWGKIEIRPLPTPSSTSSTGEAAHSASREGEAGTSPGWTDNSPQYGQ